MIQIFVNEFNLPTSKKYPPTTAKAGETLSKEDGSNKLDEQEASKYCSGVGKLIHMIWWSCNDLLNSVRELTRFMSCPTVQHHDRLHQTMQYVIGTALEGNIIQPNRSWDGNPLTEEFEFQVTTNPELS